MPAEYWRDDDGDGVDDSTGLNERDWYGHHYAGNRRFSDRNGDGLDDDTRLDVNAWTAQIGAGSNQREREAAQAQEAADRHAEDYANYSSDPRNRTRDLDEGRRPMTAEGDGVGSRGEEDIPQWVRDTRGVPIIGGPADAWLAEREARRQENVWDDLANYAPTANDLGVQYEEAKRSELAGATGDRVAMEAERRALNGFEDIYSNGGLTSGDRARLQQGQREMGRAMRSQRDADMTALRARGMGNSGAAISSTLSAQQGGADMLADREAQMQIAAQDRAMQALAGASNASSRMRASGWEEDTTRRSAMDDFTWRNIGQRDKSRESQSQARQQAYENRERQVAGRTGQYSTDVNRRGREAERNDENAKGVLSSIGELLDF